MYDKVFLDQVRLLLTCMPSLRNHPDFALKGGTAINLFYQDLPRLSVDIDLTFVPIVPREVSINTIQKSLLEMEGTIKKMNSTYRVERLYDSNRQYLLKLIVYSSNAAIKIEPNFIFRGSLYPVKKLMLPTRVGKKFNVFIDNVPVLDEAEVYAGKLCAALDRQHPRDLFDVKVLFEGSGITDKIREAFVVYLASSPRPMHEMLKPNLLDIESAYQRDFHKMTEYEISLSELLNTRQELIKTINEALTENDRQFLLSVKQGNPMYTLLPFKHLADMPALKWKLMNVAKMNPRKHALMLDSLKAVLEC